MPTAKPISTPSLLSVHTKQYLYKDNGTYLDLCDCYWLRHPWPADSWRTSLPIEHQFWMPPMFHLCCFHVFVQLATPTKPNCLLTVRDPLSPCDPQCRILCAQCLQLYTCLQTLKKVHDVFFVTSLKAQRLQWCVAVDVHM